MGDGHDLGDRQNEKQTPETAPSDKGHPGFQKQDKKSGQRQNRQDRPHRQVRPDFHRARDRKADRNEEEPDVIQHAGRHRKQRFLERQRERLQDGLDGRPEDEKSQRQIQGERRSHRKREQDQGAPVPSLLPHQDHKRDGEKDGDLLGQERDKIGGRAGQGLNSPRAPVRKPDRHGQQEKKEGQNILQKSNGVDGLRSRGMRQKEGAG